MSHLHWDHTGKAADFDKSLFVIGSGCLSLLRGDQGAESHNKFEKGLLPLDRTVELRKPEDTPAPDDEAIPHGTSWTETLQHQSWEAKGPFTHVLDIFQD